MSNRVAPEEARAAMVTASAWTGTGEPAALVWAATFWATSATKEVGPAVVGVVA